MDWNAFKYSLWKVFCKWNYYKCEKCKCKLKGHQYKIIESYKKGKHYHKFWCWECYILNTGELI